MRYIFVQYVVMLLMMKNYLHYIWEKMSFLWIRTEGNWEGPEVFLAKV